MKRLKTGWHGLMFAGSVLPIGMLLPAAAWGQGYTITTSAGGGTSTSSNVGATQAIVSPVGVAVDAAGNLYITQAASIVSKVTANGLITTIAGSQTGLSGYAGDGGPATGAQFSLNGLGPSGIAVDSPGNIFIADTENGRIRKIASNGVITTVAGGGNISSTFGDGGPATAAYIEEPTGVAVDSAGNLYIAEWLGSRVRKVAIDGTITTVTGCAPTNPAVAICVGAEYTGSLGDGGPATSAPLLLPTAVAVDGAGNLYIADNGHNRIRKVSTNGIITTVAGSGAGSYQGDGGPATSAGLYEPNGVAVDAAGNIYIDDSGDYRIRMVTTDGTITTIAGDGAEGPAFTSPASGVPATSTSLSTTYGIALGPGGVIYVADFSSVRVLTPGTPPVRTPPSITSGGVISASSFGKSTSIAPGSFIEIYGSNLAVDTRGWTGTDFNGVNAPTSLDGTSVTIGGESAYVAYVSPGQVNAQVPLSVGTGQEPLIVTTAGGSSAPYTTDVNATQPALLAPSSFNIGGKQYVAAYFADGVTFVLPPGSIAGVNSQRAQPGDAITLYGVGFGSVTPYIPAGQIEQQSNTLTQTFKVSFGSTQASVAYDGLAPGLVGIYQFNVVVPSIASNDAVPLTFALDGVAGTQTLYTSVQNGNAVP